MELRAWRETVDHYMEFGADKRFWYGALSQPPAAPEVGTPCSPVGMTCAAGMPMYGAGKTNGASAKASADLTAQDLLRAGVELQRYSLDEWWPPSGGMMSPGTFVNVNDGRRDRDAVYGEWERRFAPGWLTLLGVRYERVRSDAGEVRGYDPTTNGMGTMASFQKRDAEAFNAAARSRTDDNWDATAIARYAPDATLDLEAGIARKVRSPNLYQRYTWSTWSMAAVMNNTVGDGNGYVGNLALEPETASTASATLDWHASDRAWELRFTPYYTRVADFIDAVQWNAAANAPASVPATNQFVVLKYMNQSARLQGFDLSGAARLAKTAFGEFAVKGVLAYVDGTNRTTGDELYNIMPLNARVSLAHALGSWSGSIEAVMVGKQGRRVGRPQRDPDGGLRAREPARVLHVEAGAARRRGREPLRPQLSPAHRRRLPGTGLDDEHERRAVGDRRPRHGAVVICRSHRRDVKPEMEGPAFRLVFP